MKTSGITVVATLLLLFCMTGLLAAQSDFAALERDAAAARDANRLDEAASLYGKALALRPRWAEGWWNLGTLLYDRDAYADAAAAFERAVALNPKAGVGFAMLGLSEAKLGRNRQALEHIEAAEQLGVGGNPDLPKVLEFTRGTLLLESGKFALAQEVLGALAREGAEQPELLVALGQAVLGIIPSKMDPGVSLTVRQAGWAEHYAARREIQNALREYRALAQSAPKMHNVQFALGRFLVANHLDEEAVAAFQKEIENTPNHLLARLGIAGLLLVSDPAAGLPWAREAVKLSPKLGEAHYLLGASLLGTGQVPPAIGELEKARELAPDDPKIYFALGRAYTQAGRKEEAARARARFAELNQKSERREEHD